MSGDIYFLKGIIIISLLIHFNNKNKKIKNFNIKKKKNKYK